VFDAWTGGVCIPFCFVLVFAWAPYNHRGRHLGGVTALILTPYLSANLGYSDSEAGWYYSAYGMVSSTIGILGGFLIDNIGVRKTMLIGSLGLCSARTVMAFTSNSTVFLVTMLTLFPMGSALMFPAMLTAVKRYTSSSTRAIGFSMFYMLMVLCCLLFRRFCVYF
jgi:FSR family fosmidomycin resistance protein-like MFS transporter